MKTHYQHPCSEYICTAFTNTYHLACGDRSNPSREPQIAYRRKDVTCKKCLAKLYKHGFRNTTTQKDTDD